MYLCIYVLIYITGSCIRIVLRVLLVLMDILGYYNKRKVGTSTCIIVPRYLHVAIMASIVLHLHCSYSAVLPVVVTLSLEIYSSVAVVLVGTAVCTVYLWMYVYTTLLHAVYL